MPLIELRNVTVRSETGLILDRVSFRLEEGQKILITGPSGSGKSTLFEAILGGIALAGGAVYFLGEEVTGGCIQTLRSQVAFVGQEPLLGGGAVLDGLMLPFSFRAHRDRRPHPPQIGAILESLGMEESILEQETSKLSGGEKQRLALARALLLEVPILLLDEITSALDAANRERVLKLLGESDRSILALAHDRFDCPQFDRWARLSSGQLVFDRAVKWVGSN